MRHYLTEAERNIERNSNSSHIGLWIDGGDHMQFKCKKCGLMMDLITAPHIARYGSDGGAIYFNIYCDKCNEIHDKKLYFGSPAIDMRSSVEMD